MPFADEWRRSSTSMRYTTISALSREVSRDSDTRRATRSSSESSALFESFMLPLSVSKLYGIIQIGNGDRAVSSMVVYFEDRFPPLRGSMASRSSATSRRSPRPTQMDRFPASRAVRRRRTIGRTGTRSPRASHVRCNSAREEDDGQWSVVGSMTRDGDRECSEDTTSSTPVVARTRSARFRGLCGVP